jgi:2-iminoacetate synthase ThiH
LDQDHVCDGDFTGVEVLRAIALARLLLPAEVEVRAPLATLGPKLAQVALDFGASHLGYAALDGQTPDDPLVAPAAMLDELLNGCLRTSPREELKQL